MPTEFKSNLQAVQGMTRQALDSALEIIGSMAESHAKQLCPVDTGNLRNSITHDVEGGDTVVIGTAVNYAPYVELGTGAHAEGGGRSTPWSYQDDNGNWHTTSGMRPRPYLRPAIEEHRDEYQRVLEGEFRRFK